MYQIVGQSEEYGTENGHNASEDKTGNEPFDSCAPRKGGGIQGLGDDPAFLLVAVATNGTLVVTTKSPFQLIHDSFKSDRK